MTSLNKAQLETGNNFCSQGKAQAGDKENNRGLIDDAANFDAQQAINNDLARYFVLLLAAPTV